MAVFELFVDDNYHYMDEESRYKAGSFASYPEALAAAKAIVDDYLERCHQPGMTSKELCQGYVGFGEDPFIVPAGETRFSAWEYARARCRELSHDEDAVSSVLRYARWPPELASLGTVLLAALRRTDLGPGDRHALERFRQAMEDYPDAMPSENGWYWLRLERGSTAFTIYLYQDRFQLHADGMPPAAVDWEVRFRGSGRLDRRVGDAAAALGAMRQAALDPEFTLRAKA